MDSNTWNQIIIALSAIITTFMTVKYAPYFREKFLNQAVPTQNRLNPVYDGYERLIKDLQKDVDRARSMNEKQRIQIEHMQDKISDLNEQLSISREANKAFARKNEDLSKRLSQYEGISE